MKKDNIDDMNIHEEKIPVFSSWRSWYLFVSFSFALCVVLFYLFTKIFE